MKMAAIQELSGLQNRIAQLVPRCSGPSCRKRPLSRIVSWKQLGYFVGGRWFCTPECLQNAVKLEVLTLLNSHQNVAPRPTRIPLGLVLHSRGVITSEQLALSLAEQKKSGGSIGEAVIKLGFADELQVTSAVASQWGHPVFRVKPGFTAVQIRIPHLLMDLYRMVPVHFTEAGSRLLMGFLRAPQHAALRTIEHMTLCNAIPCFVTPSGYSIIADQINQDERDNEIVFERNTSASEIASVIRNYVLQSGASEARVGRCREYIWARVFGTKATLDIMFRLEGN